MPTITMKDGARIFYKDWGSGQPIVFSHSWPLNADAWDEQLHFFASHGYRAIAHDRRGHGRSSQTWNGNNMDTYADDLATLTTALDLTSAILVGHSTGGGEVVRYIGRHGTDRVAKAVLVGAVAPGMLKSPKNPDGLPMAAFDQIRAGVLADRSQYWKDLSPAFFGTNRPNSRTVSDGVHEQFWRLGMQCGIAAAYDGIKAFFESDFTDDLAKIDVPTLIIHGDDDQIVPVNIGGLRSATLIKGARLEIYRGASHGLMNTHQLRFHTDLLAFAREETRRTQPSRRSSVETTTQLTAPPAA